MRKLRTNASERGFTLIELLVVIIILGILAAVVVFAVSGVGDKGKSSATVIDDRTIRTAEEAYCAKNSRYASGADLVAGGFLSEVPEYHEVNARQTTDPGSGTCNGWKYFITRTDQATPHGAGRWEFVSSPPGFFESLERLADGRVFARINRPGPNLAAIWDPMSNTWESQDPPPDTPESDYPGGATDIVLVDDPSTPYSECKGAVVDNCGKVLVVGSFLFDPTKPTGSTPSQQWQQLSAPGCNVCEIHDFRGQFNRLQIKGTPAQCGLNCGKILIVTQPGAHAADPLVQPNSYDLLDPRTNTFETFAFSGSGFSPPLNAQQVLNLFKSGMAQLPDGRVFGCCESDGFTPRSAFMDISVSPPAVTEGPLPPNGYSQSSTETQPWVRLPSNEVLLTGKDNGITPQSTGVYTPSDGAAGSFASMAHCAVDVRCVVLASLSDGRVLARHGSLFDRLVETSIFNPTTRSWTRAADLPGPFDVFHDGVFLDPAGGPCGEYCGTVFGSGVSAVVYYPER